MRLLQLTGIALWLLASAAASWAQGGPDLAACFASEPELAALATRCKAHGGCTLVLDRRTECVAARGFLQRLKEQMGDYPEIENNSVMSAAMPPLRSVAPLTSRLEALTQRVRQQWRADPARQGLSLQSDNGVKSYFEGQIRQGTGVQLSANGVMLRGEILRGRMNGIGQAVTPNGVVYAGMMVDGHLGGEGAIFRPDGLVLVGSFVGPTPTGTVTSYFPDGRSQISVYGPDGTVLDSGPLASAGESAKPPDPEFVQALLSLRCASKHPDLVPSDRREAIRTLRELVRGPCGKDPATVERLASDERSMNADALRELEQARQQAAARAQADAERNATISSFLGQVSSILGSYQTMQQSAQAGAAVTAAAAAARPTSPPATVAAASSGGSTAASSSPPQSTGRTRPVHNPAADASSCVRMVQTSASTTARISGNFTFHNGCNSTVEVFWCFPRPGGACTGGGTWTIGAGKGWPVMDNEAQIRWAACRGANGGGWDRDVPAGTRYTCALLQW